MEYKYSLYTLYQREQARDQLYTITRVLVYTLIQSLYELLPGLWLHFWFSVRIRNQIYVMEVQHGTLEFDENSK